MYSAVSPRHNDERDALENDLSANHFSGCCLHIATGYGLILNPVQKLRDMKQGATGWLDARLRSVEDPGSKHPMRDRRRSA